MGSLSPMHWIIVLGVVVLLFGATKLPQLARSLGQSARIFQAETRGLREDQQSADRSGTQQSAGQQSQITTGQQGSTGQQGNTSQRDTSGQAATSKDEQADAGS